MDGPIGATNAGTPGPAPTPGNVPAPAAGAAPAPAEGAMVASRRITLVTGQQLQATVTAILGGGFVRLGLLGGTLEASTHLQLEAGRSYWFTVAATSPQVVLAAARPGAIHALAGAFAE